jgi:hypothetical protein
MIASGECPNDKLFASIFPIQIGSRLVTRFSRGNHAASAVGKLNVCVNAIHAGSADADSARWMVTQEMLEREIRKVGKVGKVKAEPHGRKGRTGYDWVRI